MIKSLIKDPKAVFGSIIVLVLVVTGIFAPFLAPHDPERISLGNRLAPPAWSAEGSPEHLLGTDALGRDLLSRLIHGARVSLIIGIVGAVSSIVIGLPLALIAGFYRGWIDEVIMRIADIFFSIPGMLLAIALVALYGPTLSTVVAAFALVSWAWVTRIIRGEVLSIREKEFIEASRSIGSGNLHIIGKHILPNVMGMVLVLTTLYVALVILWEVALAFLGLSAAASWGWDIAMGRKHLATAWWLTTFPGLAIFLVVLSLNLLGDWLRDYLDVRL